MYSQVRGCFEFGRYMFYYIFSEIKFLNGSNLIIWFYSVLVLGRSKVIFVEGSNINEYLLRFFFFFKFKDIRYLSVKRTVQRGREFGRDIKKRFVGYIVFWFFFVRLIVCVCYQVNLGFMRGQGEDWFLVFVWSMCMARGFFLEVQQEDFGIFYRCFDFAEESYGFFIVDQSVIIRQCYIYYGSYFYLQREMNKFVCSRVEKVSLRGKMRKYSLQESFQFQSFFYCYCFQIFRIFLKIKVYVQCKVFRFRNKV